MPKPKLNTGAIKLRKFLEEYYGGATGKAIEEFTKKVGCTLFAGRKWLNGERLPRPETQVKIRRITKISADDWIGA